MFPIEHRGELQCDLLERQRRIVPDRHLRANGERLLLWHQPNVEVVCDKSEGVAFLVGSRRVAAVGLRRGLVRIRQRAREQDCSGTMLRLSFIRRDGLSEQRN